MTISASGYQGFDQFVMGTSGYSTIQKYSTVERQLAKELHGSGYGRARTRKTILALLGAVVGGSKAVTVARVAGVQSINGIGVSQGGLRTIETYQIQSGVTNSADVTRLTAVLGNGFIPNFVANKDGVGAGGRVNQI